MRQPILANHAHVFPESVRADATIDRLLKLLDNCQIDEAVCFAPFEAQVAGTGIQRNDWLAKAIAPHRRLRGFGTVDLNSSDRKDQVRHIADLGFRGIKIHPNMQRFDVLCPEALEVYAAAQELRLFITFHTGVHHYRLRHYEVLKFDEIAFNFPELRFSLEHVGGYHFFPEALAVIFNNIPFPPKPGVRPKVYGGLVSVFTQKHLPFWYLPPERLMEAIRQVGAELLIFGLDFPYNVEVQTMEALKVLRELPITEEQRALILGGNLRRELEGPSP